MTTFTPQSGAELLALIQLADLPEIRLKRYGPRGGGSSRVSTPFVRAVLLALAIETDNGRRPTTLHAVCGRAAVTPELFRGVCTQLAALGLLKAGPIKRWSGKFARFRPWVIQYEQLRKIAREPAGQALVVDRDTGRLWLGMDRELLAVRDEVLQALALSIDQVNTSRDGESRAEMAERMTRRAAVVTAMLRRYKARTGMETNGAAIGAALNVDPAGVRWCLEKAARRPAAAQEAA